MKNIIRILIIKIRSNSISENFQLGTGFLVVAVMIFVGLVVLKEMFFWFLENLFG